MSAGYASPAFRLDPGTRTVHAEHRGQPASERTEHGEASARARVEVLERDDAHERLRYTVEAVRDAGYFAQGVALRAGDVVDIVNRAGRYEAADANGHPLDAAALDGFGGFFELGWDRPGDDDEAYFGVLEAQRPGAQWSVHPPYGGHDDVTGGTVRFVEAVRCAPAVCVSLRGDFEVRVRDAAPLPPMELERSPTRATFEVLLPVDASVPVRRRVDTTREESTLRNPIRGTRTVSVTTYATTRQETPLP